jgi:hypothetical protein
MSIPPHEQRVTAIVLEAVESKSPAAQAQTYRDLAQLTRSDTLCIKLMLLADRADELARDGRQLRLDLGSAE